jgi:hypothetical protein
MSTSVLTTVATVVAATATAIYMFWERAQAIKEEQSQMMCSNTSNSYGTTPTSYDIYGFPVNPNTNMQNTYDMYYGHPYQCDYNHSTFNERSRRYAQMYYNNQYPGQQPMYQSEYHHPQEAPHGPELLNSRRYMNNDEANRMRLRQQGTSISPVETMIRPNIESIPGNQMNNGSNMVYEDQLGHREMVDMHEYDIPAHKDRFSGREFTKVYDYDHSYFEPSEYMEKEYYYNQPMQRNMQFNAQNINEGNWYNQPYGVPYFKHMYDSDYTRNDIFNKRQNELGTYITPTQEHMMNGTEMPIIRSSSAHQYDRSSLPYVDPSEQNSYLSNLNPVMCNSSVVSNNDTCDNTTNAYTDRYGFPIIRDGQHLKLMESHYSYVMNLSDEDFKTYMDHKDDPLPTTNNVDNSVTYSGHGELCGPENGGPDLSRFPLLNDKPDPRRKTYIFDPSKDPKPLVKREGIPLRLHDVHQYWVDNGEAGCCGYSYGDPTRPTTPISTHYKAPQPWEDASEYNALYVDGGGIHFNYQDMLYEIRYRNIYTNPQDDPLTHMCPYDFETRTDLYHWRTAVYKKYKYDPYPFAKSDDIWRDDVQEHEYFRDNNNPNHELAKVAHFRWYRQQKEMEAWKRERENREKKARRDFYVDRALGVHNIRYCPLDPCEYISPDYYEDIDGNMQELPHATDADYYKRIADCKIGKYYETDNYGVNDTPQPNNSGVGYFGDSRYQTVYDYDSARTYMVPKPYEHQYNPIEFEDKAVKPVWVMYDPVYDISPVELNNMSLLDYYQMAINNGALNQFEYADYVRGENAPEWFNEDKFWKSIPGDALLPYEEKKMRKEYPIVVDQRINENMILSEQTLVNTAGTKNDPFAAVFNLPAWYPYSRELNNLLNRLQAPRGFRFTGDPELDRQRLCYFMSKDDMTDIEKLEYIQDRIVEKRNDPGYSPSKPSKVDGLSDNDKVAILLHNISPDLAQPIERTWVNAYEGIDDLYDAWERSYYSS